MPNNDKPTWKEIKQNPYVGRATEAVKFWWGDNPKDIATEMVKDALLFGTARKVYKVGKKGLSESKTVQDLIKKSNQHGDAIIKTVQSKWNNQFPQTVPDTTVTITKKTKKTTPVKKKTPTPTYNPKRDVNVSQTEKKKRRRTNVELGKHRSRKGR